MHKVKGEVMIPADRRHNFICCVAQRSAAQRSAAQRMGQLTIDLQSRHSRVWEKVILHATSHMLEQLTIDLESRRNAPVPQSRRNGRRELFFFESACSKSRLVLPFM